MFRPFVLKMFLAQKRASDKHFAVDEESSVLHLGFDQESVALIVPH